jgi:hypothetical protein
VAADILAVGYSSTAAQSTFVILQLSAALTASVASTPDHATKPALPREGLGTGRRMEA